MMCAERGQSTNDLLKRGTEVKDLINHYGWAKDYWAVIPVGSRVTCDPPPSDTDEDFLVFDQDGSAIEHLEAHGFQSEGNPEFYTGNDNGEFRSLRRGDTNVIVTPDREFFERFRTATELAKRFNLLEKSDRIALFQAVLYGVNATNLEV